jgi:hypothetical protein
MRAAAVGILAMTLMLAFRAEAGAQIDPRAAARLDAWETAMGGPAVWDGVRTLRYTVTTVWYDTATAAETRRRARYVWLRRTAEGWQVRVERWEANGHYVQVWDGTGAWATLNGELLPDSAAAVREIPYVAGDLTYWPGLPWKLRDPGVNLSWAESEANGAGDVLHVTFADGIGLHSGDRFWYYFGQPGSPFPTEVHYIEETTTSRDRARLTGWTARSSFPFVRSRSYRDPANRPTKAILYSDHEPNRGVPARLFRRPVR